MLYMLGVPFSAIYPTFSNTPNSQKESACEVHQLTLLVRVRFLAPGTLLLPQSVGGVLHRLTPKDALVQTGALRNSDAREAGDETAKEPTDLIFGRGWGGQEDKMSHFGK